MHNTCKCFFNFYVCYYKNIYKYYEDYVQTFASCLKNSSSVYFSRNNFTILQLAILILESGRFVR